MDPRQVMSDAQEGIEGADSFGVWVRNAGLGTIILSLVYAISAGILQLGETVMRPIQALGRGIGRLVEGTFFAGVDIIDAGAQRAILSFMEGAAAALGPFAFPAAIGVVILGIAVFSRGWRRWIGFSPLEFFRTLRR